jgi:hypothetical protein
MKRTGFKSQGKPLQRKKPMARGTTRLEQRKPPERTGTLRTHAVDQAKPAAPKKMRSRGFKGRAPTAAEKRFMDQAGAVPCVACAIDGIRNDHISLHHTKGRTAPGAHFHVLPLCAPHHQPDDTDPAGRPSVHEHPERFRERYGTEAELVADLWLHLEFTPPE